MASKRDGTSSATALARWLVYLRWTLLVLLPPTGVALSALAIGSHGLARSNLWLGVVFNAMLLASLQIYGEVQERKATKASVNAQVALAGALDQGTRPLVRLLGRVAEAPDLATRRNEVSRLISVAVASAESQCGRLVETRGNTRCVFYEFAEPDRLVRVFEFGRTGKEARPDFLYGRNDHDKSVVERARGENSFLFADLDDPHLEPGHSDEAEKQVYRCFLMVPVRTQRRSYGFLSVDSDQARSLTKADVGFAVMVSGIMATAIAMLGEDYPNLAGEGIRIASIPEPREERG